ncbi:hypothetical protein ABIG06_004660 [Bradyrhizobium sp. USDA 326]
MMPAHETYDVIVIGAGAGGMTAATVAAAEGLRVLVIEKTAFVGGTTAWSGGMVWIPANHKTKEAGLSDSVTDAVRYLSSTVPEPANSSLRAAFLARGPEAIAWLEANTEVRLQPVKAYPDYYPERLGATPGGRVLEPAVFDGARLGNNFARLRPPLPECTLFGGMMVGRLDLPHLRLDRNVVVHDLARGAVGVRVCVATLAIAARHDVASRQCARRAAVCHAAGAAGRSPLQR